MTNDLIEKRTLRAQAVATAGGLGSVNHPYRPGPFYLLLPMNTQAALMPSFNLDELPFGEPPPIGAAADDGLYKAAAEKIHAAQKVVVKVGGGCRGLKKRSSIFWNLWTVWLC
jgi:3D-(3,5/4)-trihydroxycyclohexane-1,2-dione acylhydrolase (decyclizing)